MKTAISYKQYYKIYRKYLKKIYTKSYLKTLNKHKYPYFVEFNIVSEEQAFEVLKHPKWCDENEKTLMREFLEFKGQIVKWQATGNVGKFIGIKITDFDYYYIYEYNGELKTQTAIYGFDKDF